MVTPTWSKRGRDGVAVARSAATPSRSTMSWYWSWPSTISSNVPSGSKKKAIRTSPTASTGSRRNGTPAALSSAARGSTFATLKPTCRKPRYWSSSCQVDGTAPSTRRSSIVAVTKSSTAPSVVASPTGFPPRRRV